MANRMLYESILSHFPQRCMRMAFAYGSGVFQQLGHGDMSKNMIDMIFVVDDPAQWHRENIARNSKHYSALKHLGCGAVERIQNNFGARVYFNTLVPCEGRMIKYGVIGTEALRLDLLDWEFLYTSGRLHKPVYHVIQNQNSDMDIALQTNLQSAVHTSLLILPDEFSEQNLYETITGLSYTGDPRMTFGEDRGKITNIVKPNMERFREMYEPILKRDEHIFWHKSEGILEQSLSESSRIHHLNLLPKVLTEVLVAEGNVDKRNRDTEEILRTLANDCQCRYLVRDSVAKIVQHSSTSQSIKSFFTAGVWKAWKYSMEKLRKMRRSQQNATSKCS